MAEISIDNKIFFIPEKGSPCDLWRAYFDKLKKEVGRDNAKVIWLVTWKENPSSSCTTNPDFNRWLKQNDIDVSSAATRAIADLSSIGGNVLGLGKNLSKLLSIGIPVLLGGVFLVVIIMLINTTRKMDVSDAAAMLPAGRAAKMAGGLKLLGK